MTDNLSARFRPFPARFRPVSGPFPAYPQRGLALIAALMLSCVSQPEATCPAEPTPYGAHACMDACMPDGVHLHSPCYYACLDHDDAMTSYEAARLEWETHRSTLHSSTPKQERNDR